MGYSKTELKKIAQDTIAHQISQIVSYPREILERTGQWGELSAQEQEQIKQELKKQADRCAKLFGYEEIWYS